MSDMDTDNEGLVIIRPDNLPTKRMYLAGPISGDPLKHCMATRYANTVRKAREASFIQGILRLQGWVVTNPYGSAIASENWEVPHDIWMEEGWAHIYDIWALRFMCLIDEAAVCLIPGWDTSVGACCELDYARELGLTVYEWVVKSNGAGDYYGELVIYAGGDA